jgi:hypothetical protein
MVLLLWILLAFGSFGVNTKVDSFQNGRCWNQVGHYEARSDHGGRNCQQHKIGQVLYSGVTSLALLQYGI